MLPRKKNPGEKAVVIESAWLTNYLLDTFYPKIAALATGSITLTQILNNDKL
jgi:hypothetical protein